MERGRGFLNRVLAQVEGRSLDEGTAKAARHKLLDHGDDLGTEGRVMVGDQQDNPNN